MVKFVFFPLKTKKTTFFARDFKIQGGLSPPPPLPTPMVCNAYFLQFVVVLLILLVAEVVALVMAFAFSSTLVEVLRNAARFSMSLYGSNPAVTFAWDYTQTTVRQSLVIAGN